MMSHLLSSVSYAAMAAAGASVYSPPAYNPLNATKDTNGGLYLEPDVSNWFTDAGKTTNPSTNGDEVYVWANEDSTYTDFLQATAANRPHYQTTHLSFDGSQFFTSTNNLNRNAGTMMVRFRRATVQSNATEVLIGSAASSNRCWLSLKLEASKSIASMGIGANGSDNFNDSNAVNLADNSWHTIAGTFDTDGDCILYVDGVEIERVAWLGTVSTNNIYLGSRHIGSGSVDLGFAGDISHALASRGKALSALEIERLHALWEGNADPLDGFYPDDRSAFNDVGLTYIDGGYTSTSNANLALNLDATPEGSYFLMYAGQDSSTPTTITAPTGVTNWQDITRLVENSFDAVHIIYFEVAPGAGITSITPDVQFQYRVGAALFKVTNWDPAIDEIETITINSAGNGYAFNLPKEAAILFCGTNKDYLNAEAIDVADDVGGTAFSGTNNDFYSYFGGTGLTDDGTFHARVTAVSDTSRDFAHAVALKPGPALSDDGGNHLMWRINCVGGGNGVYYSISEIEMRETVSGADVTSGETVIFTDERSGFEATKAFDDISGNADNNCWSTDMRDIGANAIGIHFATAKRIQEVVLTASDDSFFTHMPTDFNIEYSDDGIFWHIAHQVTGESSWSQNESRTYSGW